MPQLKNAEIAELADEWGRLELATQSIEEKKTAALEPVFERHNVELEGVTRKFDKQIARQRERQVEIEQLVGKTLTVRKADTAIEGEVAVAERKTETKVGPRIIDFLKFWKKAKPLGQPGVDCINVQVAKAEQLLGKKTIDAISTKKETVETVVRIRLKEEA